MVVPPQYYQSIAFSTLTCLCFCITKRGNKRQSIHICCVSFPVYVIYHLCWLAKCLHLFLLVFPKVLFFSVFFGARLRQAQWLPPQRHYARLMISLCGSRQVQMDVEMLDALSKPLEANRMGCEVGRVWRRVFFFQKEARGCWCSVKSTRTCFEWKIY